MIALMPRKQTLVELDAADLAEVIKVEKAVYSLCKPQGTVETSHELLLAVRVDLGYHVSACVVRAAVLRLLCRGDLTLQ
jgi:hypothetical protein